MALQFLRTCKVVVTNRLTGVETTVTDLRITFDINKHLDNKEKSNVGKIAIYNLKYDTVKNFGPRFSRVDLYVGYEGSPITHWIAANITNIKFEKGRGEKGTITTLELEEGFVTLKSDKMSANSVEGSTYGDIIRTIAKNIGISQSSLIGDWQEEVSTYGFPMFGTPAEILGKFCRAKGLVYSVTNNKLTILPKHDSKFPPTVDVVQLSEDSGLIGLPFFQDEEISKNYDEALLGNEELIPTDSSKEDTGKTPKSKKVRRFFVQAKALINPAINPNSIIEIVTQESDLNHLYRVRDVNFKGDTHGQEWYMTLHLENGTIDGSTASPITKDNVKKPKITGGVGTTSYDQIMKNEYARAGFTCAQMNTLKGQAQAESHLNPSAVNPDSGAFGLTQFTPATAQQYGVHSGSSTSAVTSQIAGQANYMRHLLSQFGNDWTKALAAYNAGPTTISNLIHDHGSNWLQYAPKETQAYIPKVNAYGSLYNFCGSVNPTS